MTEIALHARSMEVPKLQGDLFIEGYAAILLARGVSPNDSYARVFTFNAQIRPANIDTRLKLFIASQLHELR